MASAHLKVRGPSLSLPVAGELLPAPDFPSPVGITPVWDGSPGSGRAPVHPLTVGLHPHGCIPDLSGQLLP